MRKQGLLAGAICLGAGLLLWAAGDLRVDALFGGAVFFFVTGMWRPAAAEPILAAGARLLNAAWRCVAGALALVVYFAVVTPLGLGRRIARRFKPAAQPHTYFR